MAKKQKIMSEEDEMIDKIVIEEEGQCYGEYSARAKACKGCLIADACKVETKAK